MPYKEIITNTLPQQVYSFDAVFTAIQPYLKEGVKFDLESNNFYPQQIGTVFTFCIQEYEKVEVEYPNEPEGVTSEETQVLLEAVSEIPTVTLPKTRRAKANAETKV